MNDNPCVVMTTAGTEDEAEQLAEAIVEAGLAACVQVQHVRSFYKWDGAMQRSPEWLLMAKTHSGRFPALAAFIRERHSYETPEVLQLPVTAGSSDYLAWLRTATQG